MSAVGPEEPGDQSATPTVTYVHGKWRASWPKYLDILSLGVLGVAAGCAGALAALGQVSWAKVAWVYFSLAVIGLKLAVGAGFAFQVQYAELVRPLWVVGYLAAPLVALRCREDLFLQSVVCLGLATIGFRLVHSMVTVGSFGGFWNDPPIVRFTQVFSICAILRRRAAALQSARNRDRRSQAAYGAVWDSLCREPGAAEQLAEVQRLCGAWPSAAVRQWVDQAALLRYCYPGLHPLSLTKVSVDREWLLQAVRPQLSSSWGSGQEQPPQLESLRPGGVGQGKHPSKQDQDLGHAKCSLGSGSGRSSGPAWAPGPAAVPLMSLDQLYTQAIGLAPLLLDKCLEVARGCGGSVELAERPLRPAVGGAQPLIGDAAAVNRWLGPPAAGPAPVSFWAGRMLRRVSDSTVGGGGMAGGGGDGGRGAIRELVERGRVKCPARAVSKALLCYGGDVSRLVDLCRTRVVLRRLEDLATALKLLVQDPYVKVHRIKNFMALPSAANLTTGSQAGGFDMANNSGFRVLPPPPPPPFSLTLALAFSSSPFWSLGRCRTLWPIQRSNCTGDVRPPCQCMCRPAGSGGRQRVHHPAAHQSSACVSVDLAVVVLGKVCGQVCGQA